MAASVVVYTTDMCPYCVRAKKLLEKREIPFEEINLARDADARADLVAKTGRTTFPQVLIDGQVIGGYEETAAADRSGKLAELVGA
jgi:glutaredoxin 3